MNSQAKDFQENYWSNNKQALCFRHKAALYFLKKYKIKELIDIGCGDGFFIDQAKKLNISACGIELSKEGCQKTEEKNIEVFQSDITDEKFELKKKYDTIVCLDVLEHLFDPKKALGNLSKYCERYFILGTPNFNSISARLEVLLGKVPSNNTPRKGHCYWFNKKNLEETIENNGLKVIEWQCNTILERYLFTKPLLALFPSLFALSFVVLCKKK